MKFRLVLNVELREKDNFSNGLRVAEELELNAASFMDLAKILGSFHELAERLRRERA
jgi:hypothetical protein